MAMIAATGVTAVPGGPLDSGQDGAGRVRLFEVPYDYRMNLWRKRRKCIALRVAADRRNNMLLGHEMAYKQGEDYVDTDSEMRQYFHHQNQAAIRDGNDYIDVEGVVPIEFLYTIHSGDPLFRVVHPATIDLHVGYDMLQSKVVCAASRREGFLASSNLEARAKGEAEATVAQAPFARLEEMRYDAGMALRRAAEHARMCNTGRFATEKPIDPLIVVLTGFDADPWPMESGEVELSSIVAGMYDDICRLIELEKKYDSATDKAANPTIFTRHEPPAVPEMEAEPLLNKYGNTQESYNGAIILQNKQQVAANNYNRKKYEQDFQDTVMSNAPIQTGEAEMSYSSHVARLRRNADRDRRHNIVQLEAGEEVSQILQPTIPKENAEERAHLIEMISQQLGIPSAFAQQASSSSMKGNADMLQETKDATLARRAEVTSYMLTTLMRAVHSAMADTPKGILATYREWLRPKMQRQLVDYMLDIAERTKKITKLQEIREQAQLQQMLETHAETDQQQPVVEEVDSTDYSSSESEDEDEQRSRRSRRKSKGKRVTGNKRSRKEMDRGDRKVTMRRNGESGIRHPGEPASKKQRVDYGLLNEDVNLMIEEQANWPFMATQAKLQASVDHLLRSQSTGMQLEGLVKRAIMNESLQYLYYMPEKAEWLQKKMGSMRDKSRRRRPPADISVELRKKQPPGGAQQDPSILQQMRFAGFISPKDCIRAARSMLNLPDTPDTAREIAELEQTLKARDQLIWQAMENMVKTNDVPSAITTMQANSIVDGAKQVAGFQKKQHDEKVAEEEKAKKEKEKASAGKSKSSK